MEQMPPLRPRSLADHPAPAPVLADELEEGECAPPGYHSSSDTEDYYNRDAVSSGLSDETVSDDRGDATASSAATNRNRKGNASASSAGAKNRNAGATASSVLEFLYGRSGVYSVAANNYYNSARPSPSSFAAAAAAAAAVSACRVCGKVFASKKAMCGHMKVHALEAIRGGKDLGDAKNKKGKKKREVEVVGGWGVTRKRGCSGLKTSVDSVVEEDSPKGEQGHSMDAAPAEPKPAILATPVAWAMPENSSTASMASARTNLSGESSSKKPIHNDDAASMDVAEAGASPTPPTKLVVYQRFTCKEPGCDRWYTTPQALGGHVNGHKSKQAAAAAAAEGNPQDGAVPSGSKPKKRHICDVCFREFDRGVQLGGHKRKHFTGDLSYKTERKKRPPQQLLPPPADVTAAPAFPAPPIKAEMRSPEPAVDAAQPAPPAAAAEGTTPEPSPAPRVTGRVILFGIDIGLEAQKPPAQEGSPETKEDSPASNPEQQ